MFPFQKEKAFYKDVEQVWEAIIDVRVAQAATKYEV